LLLAAILPRQKMKSLVIKGGIGHREVREA